MFQYFLGIRSLRFINAVQKLTRMSIFELRGIRSLLYIKVGLNATESVAFRPVDKHSVNDDDETLKVKVIRQT